MSETTEFAEIRLRRLRMRSWRRGMKEMDMILGPFSDGPLAQLSEAELASYEEMMEENDQKLYRWITARVADTPEVDRGPGQLASILDRIAAHAAARFTAQDQT